MCECGLIFLGMVEGSLLVFLSKYPSHYAVSHCLLACVSMWATVNSQLNITPAILSQALSHHCILFITAQISEWNRETINVTQLTGWRKTKGKIGKCGQESFTIHIDIAQSEIFMTSDLINITRSKFLFGEKKQPLLEVFKSMDVKGEGEKLRRHSWKLNFNFFKYMY